MAKRLKRDLQMNEKRRKLLQARARGMSMTEAAKFAGYSCLPAASYAFKTIRLYLPEIFAREGMPAKRLVKKLISLTEAKETKFWAKDGIVLDSRTVDDNATQLGAASEIARIFGFHPQREETNGDQAAIGGPTFNLFLVERGEQKAIMGRLASVAGSGIELGVDAALDEDEGRAGSAEPV